MSLPLTVITDREHQMTNEERGRAIGSSWCDLYHCEAYFFIKLWQCGTRTLVVQYGEGYAGPYLPVAENGQREFSAVIPPHRTEEEVAALLLTPPLLIENDPYLKTWPTWEVGARYFGSEYLAWPKAPPTFGEAKQ
jgi:hypothetical protein